MPFRSSTREKGGKRMNRARLVRGLAAAVAAASILTVAAPLRAKHAARQFHLVETSIPAIQEAIEDGVITAEQLVGMYQKRIAAYNGPGTATHLNAYIHLNEHARADAEKSEGREGGEEDERGHARPLRGIPMILKDNIDTKDMPTTAGS